MIGSHNIENNLLVCIKFIRIVQDELTRKIDGGNCAISFKSGSGFVVGIEKVLF